MRRKQIKARIRELEVEQARGEAAVEMAEKLQAPSHVLHPARDAVYRTKIVIATFKEALQ